MLLDTRERRASSLALFGPTRTRTGRRARRVLVAARWAESARTGPGAYCTYVQVSTMDVCPDYSCEYTGIAN